VVVVAVLGEVIVSKGDVKVKLLEQEEDSVEVVVAGLDTTSFARVVRIISIE